VLVRRCTTVPQSTEISSTLIPAPRNAAIATADIAS
jgi:hypothetical protein